MKKSNVLQALKEITRDLMIIIGMAVIVVFPFVFILFVMWVQKIIVG